MKSLQRRILLILGAVGLFAALNVSAAMASGAPQVFSPNPVAKEITASSATVSAVINPNGASTTYQFEYGTTVAYGFKAPATPKSMGTEGAIVSEQLKSLKSSTTYHVRVVASNEFGTTKGEDKTFTTAAVVGFFNAKTGLLLGAGSGVHAVSHDIRSVTPWGEIICTAEFNAEVVKNAASPATLQELGYIELPSKCTPMGGAEVTMSVTKETFQVKNKELIFSTNATFTFDSTLQYVLEFAGGAKMTCNATSTAGTSGWSPVSGGLYFHHVLDGGLCGKLEWGGDFTLSTVSGDPAAVRLM